MKRMFRLMSLVLTLTMLLGMTAVGFSASAISKGDCNGDGLITSTDSRLVLMYATGNMDALDEEGRQMADLNGDGNISSSNARLILMMAMEEQKMEYANVTRTDEFGNRSIAILGDSISHGAGSVDIPNNSYVGLLKKAVNAKTGYSNYGFTTAEGTLWGSVVSNEIHNFPSSSTGFKDRDETGDGWTEYRTSNLLGTKGFGGTKLWSYLEFQPKQSFNYFCVYYQAGPGRGMFSVCTPDSNDAGIDLTDMNGTVIVNCNQTTETYKRTGFYRFSDLNSNKLRIAVQSSNGAEVLITGIGYYNELDGVVVNNYSNGGLKLSGGVTGANGDVSGLDKKFLDLGAQSETLIFSLGYNDSHFASNQSLFTEKINYLIAACKRNKTHVVVNDLCWYIAGWGGSGGIVMDKNTIDWYKSELKRLATETNGLYVDQQAINGQAILDTVFDGAHPNAAGHKIIADTLIRLMNLA